MRKNPTPEPMVNASLGYDLSRASTLIDRLEVVGEVIGALDMMTSKIEDECYRLPFRRIIELAESELAFAQGLVENDVSRLRSTAEKMRTVATAAKPAAPAKKAMHDPLLAAIAAHQEGEAAFEAIPEEDYPAHGGEDAVVEKTYGAPYRVLSEWSRPALSRAAAVEALRLAHAENKAYASSPAAKAMVAAALAYFEGEGA